MNQNEATKKRNVKFNLITSIIAQGLVIIVNLFIKAEININLGFDYLGLQTVYSNFCDIFTFAFLGTSIAFLYSLYEPLEKNDYIKIIANHRFFEKIYKYMSLCVLGVGLVSTFLVLFVIDDTIPNLQIIITYTTYLFSIIIFNRGAVRQYFIIANNRHYIVWIITIIVEIVFFILQIYFLNTTQSFYIYIIIFLFKNLAYNLSFTFFLKKKYKYLYTREKIDYQVDKKFIYSNIKDLIITRVGMVLINNTDSIVTSVFVSTAVSGLYANYLFVYMGVVSILLIYFQALTARIGNFIVLHNKEEIFKHFWNNSIVNVCIVGFCTTAFYLLIQDFITIWIGEDGLLSQQIVILVSLNVFLYGMRTVTSSYRNAAGLFSKISKLFIIRGVVNLILSLIGGYYFGVVGILVATVVANLTIGYIYEAKVVYKYFEKSMKNELLYQVLGISSTLLCITFTGFIISFVSTTGYLGFTIKTLLCVFSIGAFYSVFYGAYILIKKNRKGA